MTKRSWWTAGMLGCGLLVALLVGLSWDTPLSPDFALTRLLAGLCGSPVYLGPVLLTVFLVLIGAAVLARRGILWAVAKYVLGVGLLAVVIWQYWSYPGPDGRTLGLVNAIDRPVNFGPLVLALFLCMAAVLLTFVRWYLLVLAQDLPFTLPDALRLGMIGYYLNTFLPGSVGGDIIKATYIARAQSRRTVAVATVLLDRAIGLVGLFWLVALVGGVFWLTGSLERIVTKPVYAETLEFIVSVALVFLVGSLAFWVLLGVLPRRRAEKFAWRLTRIPKIGNSLSEFWRAVWMYRCRGRSVALALGLAMIGHVGFVLTFYFAAQTLNRPAEIPTARAHFLLVPVGMSIQAGFPAPGGVGGGEVGYGELYRRVGCDFDKGVLGSLTQRAVTWILGLAGYLVYLRLKPALRPLAREAGPEEPPAPEPLADHYPPPHVNGQVACVPSNDLAGRE